MSDKTVEILGGPHDGILVRLEPHAKTLTFPVLKTTKESEDKIVYVVEMPVYNFHGKRIALWTERHN